MRKISLYLLLFSVMLSSCSYKQFSAAATGSSLGGMFGSSIGGLMGGPRGADKGTLAGMLLGGAVGVAVTTPRHTQEQPIDKDYRQEPTIVDEEAFEESDNDVEYGTYNSSRYQPQKAALSELEWLEVENILFLDENNNHRLDLDEKAYIIMDIKNRGDKMLYNIRPQITCNSNRVVISPAATITALASGRGVRYKAMVQAYRKLKKDDLQFTVTFGEGKQAVQAKTFRIRTR